MKKLILLSLIMTTSAPIAFAAGEAAAPAVINSRIFSTQNATPLDTLERTHYTNSSILQLENKNKTDIKQQLQDSNETPVSEKKKGGLFKGFKVIW